MLAVRTLGDTQTHQMVASGVSTGLTTAAMFDPEPFSKAALIIAAAMTSIFRNAFSGCGQTCVAATQVVNQIEPYLEQNLENYFGQPIRTLSMQQQALGVFDSAWAQVVAGCGDPSLGDPGRRCISERQAGGVAPWCPNPGHTGCDWFTLYRDPIASDTPMPDSAVAGATSSGSAGSSPSGLLLLAAAAALVVVYL